MSRRGVYLSTRQSPSQKSEGLDMAHVSFDAAGVEL
jgi:hypothetical protein